MNTIKFLGEQVIAKLSSLTDWDNLEDFVQEFQTMWLELGQTVQQNLVQQKIEAFISSISFWGDNYGKRPSKLRFTD